MPLKLKFTKHVLKFKFNAGTSRGVLNSKDSWIIKIYDDASPKIFGLGEVSVIERLSLDYAADFDGELEHLKSELIKYELPKSETEAYQLVHELVDSELPALRFAVEMALLDLINGGTRIVFDNEFFSSEKPIPINGLIWMGDEAFMQEQLDEKLKDFKCIKLKIGSLDFDSECEILRNIRKKYSSDQLVLRVDANGAFLTQDVIKKLTAWHDLV